MPLDQAKHYSRGTWYLRAPILSVIVRDLNDADSRGLCALCVSWDQMKSEAVFDTIVSFCPAIQADDPFEKWSTTLDYTYIHVLHQTTSFWQFLAIHRIQRSQRKGCGWHLLRQFLWTSVSSVHLCPSLSISVPFGKPREIKRRRWHRYWWPFRPCQGPATQWPGHGRMSGVLRSLSATFYYYLWWIHQHTWIELSKIHGVGCDFSFGVPELV